MRVLYTEHFVGPGAGVSWSHTVRLSYAQVLIVRPPPAPASVGVGGRTTASRPRLIPTARMRPWPGAIARRACRPLSLQAGRRPRSDPQHSRPPPGHRALPSRDSPAHRPSSLPPPPPPSLPPSRSPLPPPSPPPPPSAPPQPSPAPPLPPPPPSPPQRPPSVPEGRPPVSP